MLKKHIRERQEFVYRRSEQHRANVAQKRKASHLETTAEAAGIPEGINLVSKEGSRVQRRDDEYRYAGAEDPKILLTTSRDPSSKLKEFVKELKLVFPNAQRINRGGYHTKQLIDACRANNVTDLIVVNEVRGKPTMLVVCHLPYGPTAYFSLSNVVPRHDIPDREKISEAYPHLIFENFITDIASRFMDILKFLFPVPKEDSKRVMTFINNQDYISFRHHVYKHVSGSKDIDLQEIGPRFEMKPFKILSGTIDKVDTARVEWTVRPFMNTSHKRLFLSNEKPLISDNL